jgi:leukotriene-A4 hydrolase
VINYLKGTINAIFIAKSLTITYFVNFRWDAARSNEDFSGFKSEEYENLTIDQKVVFMERLTELAPFPHTVISALENIYNLKDVKNCEVKFRWQIVSLIANYEPLYPKVAEFLVQQGRMKYVRPLYK